VWKNEWLKKPKNSFSKTQQQRKTATHQNQRQYVKNPKFVYKKAPSAICEHVNIEPFQMCLRSS